jgi:hypothetical protein
MGRSGSSAASLGTTPRGGRDQAQSGWAWPMIAKALSSVNQMATSMSARSMTRAALATRAAPNVYARRRGASWPGFPRHASDAGEAFASPAPRSLRRVPVKRVRAVAGVEIAAGTRQLAQRSQTLDFRCLVHTALPRGCVRDFPAKHDRHGRRPIPTAKADVGTLQRPCSPPHEPCRRDSSASNSPRRRLRRSAAAFDYSTVDHPPMDVQWPVRHALPYGLDPKVLDPTVERSESAESAPTGHVICTSCDTRDSHKEV